MNVLSHHLQKFSQASSSSLFAIPLRITLILTPSPDSHESFYCCTLVCPFQDFKQMESFRMCSFLDWLLPLSIVFLRLFCYQLFGCLSIHSFLLLSSIPYEDMQQFVYPVTCWWHLGYFQFLPISNKAIMSICVQVFVWTYASISLEGKYLGMAKSYCRYIVSIFTC